MFKDTDVEMKTNKTAKHIYIGILAFILLICLILFVCHLIHYVRYMGKYGKIYKLLDDNDELRIERIYDHGDLGVEIFFQDIHTVSSETMKELYGFSKELEKLLNENKSVLSDTNEVRPVRITADLRFNSEQNHTLISNCRTLSDLDSTKYSFDTYYCYQKCSSFDDIGYMSDARNLLFFYDVAGINGCESFDKLRYLYIKTDSQNYDSLKKLLPDCDIEFEEDGTQRIVFG